MSGPTRAFWQQRFEADDTPWDRGGPSPRWDDGARHVRPGERVVVPGCGSGWDVAALAEAGADVTAIDYAPAAVARTRRLLDARGLSARVVEADVLAWAPDRPVDAVFEQTCLCAIHPDHWLGYASQLHAWLVPGGRLIAQFMQVHRPGAADGLVEGPPYHGDVNAMRALFDASRWTWPAPPYARLSHPRPDLEELAVTLVKVR